LSTELSIIVPVYNEADNVLPMAREVAAAMDKQTHSYELVFVDDASTDTTWQQIELARQKDPRVCGFRHARNSGQSAAVWTGIQGTRTPLIATLDGDLQNDPADLPKMLGELGSVDFVCGKRLKRNDSWVRRASSKIARWFRTRALKADFQDTGCAIRVFKRETMEGILPFNGLHRFLPILVHANGFRTVEVPVNHRARVAGVSKYGVWNRVWRGMYDLIGVGWLIKKRLRKVEYSELR
jgi:dolichol-phosphate mannosyltransferase